MINNMEILFSMKGKWTLIFTVLFSIGLWGQSSTALEEQLEQLLINEGIDSARTLLEARLSECKSKGDLKCLSELVYWKGKLELESESVEGIPKAMALANEITSKSTEKRVLYQTYIGLSNLYNEIGNASKAYDVGALALGHAQSLKVDTLLVDINYYMGEYGLRSGNINTFEQHTREANQILRNHPTKNFPLAARVLNYMGALMYLTNKPDSAFHYYRLALDRVETMPDKPENRLYFPAAIKANMVLLKQNQGDYEEALELAKECVVLNNRFLKVNKHPLKYRAERNLSLAYRNLTSLYEQVGDYEKANTIAEIAYKHAKKTFRSNVQEYFSAMSLLAETRISLKEFDGAIKILEEAENSLNSMEGDNYLHKANLYSILGNTFYGKKDYHKAKTYYLLSKKYHEIAQTQELGNDHLFVLINLGLTRAHLNEKTEAQALLENAHNELVSKKMQNSRRGHALVTAMARASFLLGDYENCIKWTHLFLMDAPSSKDAEVYKPEILLLKAKALYQLNSNKGDLDLNPIAMIIEQALTSLEEKRALVVTQQNVGQLIEDNQEIFEFAKQLNLELYQKTEKKGYLEKVLQFHESSIYNRIRTRLNLKSKMSFLNVPQHVQNREIQLKTNLTESVDGFSLVSRFEDWTSFLDSLKVVYPEYYKMRYASLIVPMDQVDEGIPENTTLVRYLFIDDKLYVYVANNRGNKLVPLGYDSILEKIGNMDSVHYNLEEVSDMSYQLYKFLWEPIENDIARKNVIIFPDRELFNLSFELLASKKISTYRELATVGLLAKHNISYNYSLFMLGGNKKVLEFDENFVAFAPEFSTKMKGEYELAISDSLYLDKTYLTLLPQPFNSELVKKISKKFHGPTYLNEDASKQLFSLLAQEHKIIHIATHAESNNVNPELSRLVFAKNVSDSIHINDNYLYTYEIYDKNLSSNLAILTACETGKPSYQPGEGMISLAHAFNYAGSESILTSLWQIDEKSSSEILTSFYQYLSKGKHKDEAIRLAKLDYLTTAQGRTLHPQYWAGLVLMGDTAPIEFEQKRYWIWALVGSILLIAILIFFLKRKPPQERRQLSNKQLN